MELPDATAEPLARFCAELAQLRADAGRPTLRELSGIRGVPNESRLSEIFQGRIKKPPDRDVVRSLVAACLAHGQHQPLHGPRSIGAWMARYDDLTQTLEQQRPVRPQAMATIDEWNPFALGVHHSITVDSAELGATLTPYVPRRHDGQLRRLLKERQPALMAVLVGESSTGKTRGMLEAVRACVPDWPLAHPPDAGALLVLVEALRPPMVLWLNETQRYLDGPMGPAVAQALHRLLSMPPGPVVVLGSMWLRQHWERFTHVPAQGLPDPYVHARELLRGLAHRIDVPPTFDDPVAQQVLDKHTKRDRRLARARDTADAGRVIQVLAGGVELANQYDHPTDPFGHAVLTAAIDARRLGFLALLPEEFLRHAAPGYLDGRDRSSPAAQSGKWFADALAYAQHPVHGVAALTPDRRQEGMGEPDGFQLHDYLDQHGRSMRRAEHVPATTWDGLVAHTTDAGDLVRVIEQATDRALYRHACGLFDKATAAGVTPPLRFQRYLHRIGLMPESEPSHRHIASETTMIVQTLKAALDINQLVRWLEHEGRRDEIESALRYAVMLDVPRAHERLVEWLTKEGRLADVETAWRDAFAEGRPHAWERLAGWLAGTGRPGDAELVLRQAIGLGEYAALYQLTNLLHTAGRDDEVEQVLRDATDAGHVQAPGKLAELLCTTGRLAEAEHALRHAILIGHSPATAATLLGSAGEVAVSTSSTLLHVPYDLDAEPRLDPEVRARLAFARQKVREVVALGAALKQGVTGTWADAAQPPRRDDTVRARIAGLTDADWVRAPYAERAAAQQRRLNLPRLATTTIGSFPQTAEIRAARAALRNDTLDDGGYLKRMRDEIARVIALQEDIGLDVLVHGEPERNDMVQYFAEHVSGVASTELGWVQSYGSRCVRPPIIHGDVSRPAPMTVDWISYAQSLSVKPVKGMLTGPVTILAWSFVRDDQPLADTAAQVALALRDEIADLEAAGIGIVQVDEPALRELLPLRAVDQPAYLEWSVGAFRLATAGAEPSTQIHTHLCYSEFGEVLDAIDGMDADVTTIEAARSKMEILADLRGSGFGRGVGPGVYDIHSPRVPDEDEVTTLLTQAAAAVPGDRLWVNPDCGLKTRGYAEVEPALRNLVAAARRVRATLPRL